MRRTTARLLGACLCLALLVSTVASPAAAGSDTERFLVEPDAEGDAVVSVTLAYDLDDEAEGAAFEELGENATARAQMAERFENRMAAVAADASAAADREMSVDNASVELRRNEETGIVTLSLEWSNLAAVDGDRLTVAEPFASGFEPDRAFTVAVPDGYAIASATPAPAHGEETSVTWEAGSDLQNLEVVAEAGADGADGSNGGANAAEPDEAGTEDSPGFGILVAATALFVAGFVGSRKRR